MQTGRRSVAHTMPIALLRGVCIRKFGSCRQFTTEPGRASPEAGDAELATPEMIHAEAQSSQRRGGAKPSANSARAFFFPIASHQGTWGRHRLS